MIKILKSIILLSIILISFLNLYSSTFANYKNSQYISLNPQSPKSDIEKFQEFFKALKIYTGKIDGKYSSIKPDIVKFQIKAKIIKSDKDIGAGYIGPKTYKYFFDKYGEKFQETYSKYFKIKIENIKNETCFVVSAYYSPLPNQKRYSGGSYAKDIKMNGNGTHGASGEAVHPGFIAAPSVYPFGTKIQIDGLGIGVVEDRGGAIVRKGVRGHKCDRLDIWMGYGDEGLTRALNWGKKEVKGKIVDRNTKITISFSTQTKKYLAKKIKPESSKTDLEIMQKLFLKAKLYNGKIDGKYSSFKNSIIDFQVKNKIIKNKNDYAAGYIGSKTISKLEELYPNIFVIVRKEDVKNKKIIKSDKKIIENKTGNIPKKVIETKSENIVKTIDGETKGILKKYNITLKTKLQVEKLNKKINNYFNKKIGDNKLKQKTAKNKLKRKLDKIIKKTKNIKTKAKFTYLKSIIK